MRTVLVSIASVLLASSLLAASAQAATAGSTNTMQIYQQRLSDGRIVLTDRPSPTATTERTWQVDQEDRAAARQRGLDVKAEAQAVTERVQRSIDLRERLADAAQERMARAAPAAGRSARDDSYDGIDDGVAVVAPYGFGRSLRNHRHVRPRARMHTGLTASQFAHLTQSAPLGSR